MKVAINTIRTISKKDFVDYCVTLRKIGVPLEVIREFMISGKAEWTTPDDNGGIVTTSYEVLDQE
jgi:hypothetical protein